LPPGKIFQGRVVNALEGNPYSAASQALAAMERSRVPELRQLMTVLKTVASLHYGALPEVRLAIGYHR